MCACVEKAGKQDANCIPQDDPDGQMPLAEFYKNHCNQSKQESYKSVISQVEKGAAQRRQEQDESKLGVFWEVHSFPQP